MVKVLASALMATMAGLTIAGWAAAALRDTVERLF
jgi:hypothetical protein